MITLKVKGDLIKAFTFDKFDAIVHGCNCFCNMGAGIAKTIANEFPMALETDEATRRGDESKLGRYTAVETEYGDIINAYTQFHYGFGKVNCDYDAILKVFTQLNKDYKGKTIGIPLIGCGLAGGDWNIVEKLINESTPDINVIVYYM